MPKKNRRKSSTYVLYLVSNHVRRCPFDSRGARLFLFRSFYFVHPVQSDSVQRNTQAEKRLKKNSPPLVNVWQGRRHQSSGVIGRREKKKAQLVYTSQHSNVILTRSKPCVHACMHTKQKSGNVHVGTCDQINMSIKTPAPPNKNKKKSRVRAGISTSRTPALSTLHPSAAAAPGALLLLLVLSLFPSLSLQGSLFVFSR